MNSKEPPDWVLSGTGDLPSSCFQFRADSKITAFSGMREGGDFVVVDDIGTLYRINAEGRVLSLTRLPDPARAIAWADTGEAGIALIGKNTLVRLDEHFKTEWTVEVPFDCLSLSIDPHGVYSFVSSSERDALILDHRGKRAASFETMRPLSSTCFMSIEPVILGAAEHGLLGAYAVDGKKLWEEKHWSNVGQLAVAELEPRIFLAAMNHGIQVYDGSGSSVTAYILDGTVNHVAAGYEAETIYASTIEKQFYRLDSAGEILWMSEPEHDLCDLYCHPLGHTCALAFREGWVVLLAWRKRAKGT